MSESKIKSSVWIAFRPRKGADIVEEAFAVDPNLGSQDTDESARHVFRAKYPLAEFVGIIGRSRSDKRRP